MTIKRKSTKKITNVVKGVSIKQQEFAVFVTCDECVHVKAKSYNEARKIVRAQYSFMFNRKRSK